MDFMWIWKQVNVNNVQQMGIVKNVIHIHLLMYIIHIIIIFIMIINKQYMVHIVIHVQQEMIQLDHF